MIMILIGFRMIANGGRTLFREQGRGSVQAREKLHLEEYAELFQDGDGDSATEEENGSGFKDEDV